MPRFVATVSLRSRPPPQSPIPVGGVAWTSDSRSFLSDLAARRRFGRPAAEDETKWVEERSVSALDDPANLIIRFAPEETVVGTGPTLRPGGPETATSFAHGCTAFGMLAIP
jgi:hypothetical protein